MYLCIYVIFIHGHTYIIIYGHTCMHAYIGGLGRKILANAPLLRYKYKHQKKTHNKRRIYSIYIYRIRNRTPQKVANKMAQMESRTSLYMNSN